MATLPRNFILVTGLVYFFTPAVAELAEGSLILIVNAVIFLVFWIGFPFALHKDRKYMKKNFDWESSKLYYLGFLPSYIGLIFVLGYLYERDKKAK